jgi:hypothetical protein
MDLFGDAEEEEEAGGANIEPNCVVELVVVSENSRVGACGLGVRRDCEAVAVAGVAGRGGGLGLTSVSAERERWICLEKGEREDPRDPPLGAANDTVRSRFLPFVARGSKGSSLSLPALDLREVSDELRTIGGGGADRAESSSSSSARVAVARSAVLIGDV